MASEDANIQERQDVMSWDTYFMATAFLARYRSKDPDRKVGACVVNDDKKIVGIGYNGFPTGCEFSWAKNTASPLDSKHFYVCHAEMNAIVYRNTGDVKGCSIYVTHFPCNGCAKVIIQSGIKTVHYIKDDEDHKPKIQASKKLLDEAGVEYITFVPPRQYIIFFRDCRFEFNK